MQAASDKPDMKFMREAAKVVWGAENPDFNPKADLSDSLYLGNSAVFIAIDHNVNAVRNNAEVLSTMASAENREYFGETTADIYSRYMVKLNDANAIEDFSSLSFLPNEKIQSSGFDVYERKQAVGARIHKPDGTIVDIDVAQALPVTEGKKNEVTEFTLPLPGLEEGDVLEYFKYNRYIFLGDQSIQRNFMLMSEYPTAVLTFNGEFDKDLTANFNTFNGLEAEAFGVGHGERNIVKGRITGIPRFNETSWVNAMRQVPFLRLSLSDNLSRIFGHPESSRRGGVYFNIVPTYILLEAAEMLEKIKIPDADASKARNLYNNWVKANPEATPEQKADAAWIASVYTAMVSKNTYNNWSIICLFHDLASKSKLGLPVQLGITTANDDIAIQEIASYTQATPLVKIGDKYYMFDQYLVTTPGEIATGYNGEKVLLLTGSREGLYERQKAKVGLDVAAIKESRAKDNSMIVNTVATIPDIDNDKVDLNFDAKASGHLKVVAAPVIILEDPTTDYSEFLGIPENKRQKIFDNIEDNRPAINEYLEKISRTTFAIGDNDNVTVDSVWCGAYNPVTGDAAFTFGGELTVDDQISNAGDDRLLKVGILFGLANVKTDTEKEREIDAVINYPKNYRRKTVLKVPEGYTVDATSLDDLKSQVNNKVGNLMTEAKYEPATNEITLTYYHRINSRVVPVADYPLFNDIIKATKAVSEKSIVLHKK
ncbi:MAG: DUF3857 domain-containing protein [Lachnoclostridium sp.]|nr:DUF3857 domain-containing protein [Lachnoclostridium sp.]